MKRVIPALIMCLLLTGCWDEYQLKKLLFVDVIGVDYKDDSKQLNVGYVISSLKNANQGGGESSNLFVEASGENLYDSVSKVNKVMPGRLSVLETRLYLISAKFAKDQPLNYLNITNQFTSNPLYAYLALYDGDLSQLLAKKEINKQTVSNYLVGLLDDEIRRGRIPSNKLLYYTLGGRGFMNDFALNRFEPYENGARLAGTSLFREGKYTGVNLNDDDTQLALLLDGEAGNNQLIIGETGNLHYTIQVQNAKRNLHISYKKDSILEMNISLKLGVKLIEDEREVKKHDKKMYADLEMNIANDLKERTSNVITTLQKANCDYLQLGHEVAAFHPKLYKGMNWREQYPKISIKPNIKIEILNYGILD